MQFVCDEIPSSDGKWYYEKDRDVFIRMTDDTLTAKIYAKYLISPEKFKADNNRNLSEVPSKLWGFINA